MPKQHAKSWKRWHVGHDQLQFRPFTTWRTLAVFQHQNGDSRSRCSNRGSIRMGSRQRHGICCHAMESTTHGQSVLPSSEEKAKEILKTPDGLANDTMLHETFTMADRQLIKFAIRCRIRFAVRSGSKPSDTPRRQLCSTSPSLLVHCNSRLKDSNLASLWAPSHDSNSGEIGRGTGYNLWGNFLMEFRAELEYENYWTAPGRAITA